MNAEQKKLLKQLAKIGDVVLIQDGGKRIKLNEEAEISLATQLDAVLYFMQRLDVGMLKLVLEDCNTYQDYDKKTFLRKLSYVFDAFTTKGNSFLNLFEGKCNSSICTNMNCIGYSFLGNKTNDYMDLILEIKEDKVFDIYECNNFSNENDTIQKRDKITIDNLDFPF